MSEHVDLTVITEAESRLLHLVDEMVAAERERVIAAAGAVFAAEVNDLAALAAAAGYALPEMVAFPQDFMGRIRAALDAASGN